MLAILAGCAGRPEGVLIPTKVQAQGVSKVDVLVATTRKASPTPGILFSGERGKEPQVTEIQVSIPPDKNRKIGQVQWPQRLPPDPSREFATTAVRDMAPDQARGWLRQNLPKSRRVLVFVHGFNNRYEDAVYRFAQIVHDSGADVAPFFSPGPPVAASLPTTMTRRAPTSRAMRWKTCCVALQANRALVKLLSWPIPWDLG